MKVSQNTRVTMMLTVENGVCPPLDLSEWNSLVGWLVSRSMYPEELIYSGVDLTGAPNSEKVRGLLDIGLRHDLEGWERDGIWVVTRTDDDYPHRLRLKLGDRAPACLFGYGDRSLLYARPSIAIMGTRDAPEADREYSLRAGADAAAAGCAVVSGNALGVDRAAVRGCLDAGGRVVVMVPHGLLKALKEADYRNWLETPSLTFVSHRSPDAVFNRNESRRRSSYIYALADAALAVYSAGSNDEWRGPIYNLRMGLTPMYVRSDSSPASRRLLGADALPVPVVRPGVDVERMVRNRVLPRK